MDMTGNIRDPRLSKLELPMRHLGEVSTMRPGQALETEVFGKGNHHSQSSVVRPCADLATLQIGQVKAIAIRTTPVITREEGEDYSTLAMLFSGDKCVYRDGTHSEEMEPGNIHLNPRTGGSVDVGFFSGIICEIEHKTLRRTIHAMHGDEFKWNPEKSYVLKNAGQRNTLAVTAQFWSLMALTDQFLSEYPYLASGLGLDDQLYRRLALSIFWAEGVLEKVEQRWKASTQKWSTSLDELIDYIRANTHRQLSITDLEEQSCYSARHLQNLFRMQFGCTPMQFVRRQRLNNAMAQLQSASWGTRVIQVARDCGYANPSTFSCDFKREFGITPSTVLRSALREQA